MLSASVGINMTAFDKAWKFTKQQVKETLNYVPTEQWEAKKAQRDIDDLNDALSHRDKEGNYDKLGQALSRARRQERKPLPKNLGGMVRTGEKEPPEPDNDVSEGPDWRDER